MTLEALEAAWRAAHETWLANPTPATERAVDRAADTLRRARQDEWQAEGVTNATLREVHEDDDEGEGEWPT